MTADTFFFSHTKLTRSLRKFITDYEAQLEPAVFEAFLLNLHDELENAKAQIFSLPPGEARARKLQQLVDDEIANGSDIPVSCQKGCSACCHMEVEITTYEADILRDQLKNGVTIDRNRLQRQSGRSLQDPLWKQGPRNPDSRCVFLNDEGSCRIYEHRPVMCRRHSVTSPAKNCDTLDDKITIRYFPRVDLYISAANEDAKVKVGPLAKMLQMELLSSDSNK